MAIQKEKESVKDLLDKISTIEIRSKSGFYPVKRIKEILADFSCRFRAAYEREMKDYEELKYQYAQEIEQSNKRTLEMSGIVIKE